MKLHKTLTAGILSLCLLAIPAEAQEADSNSESRRFPLWLYGVGGFAAPFVIKFASTTATKLLASLIRAIPGWTLKSGEEKQLIVIILKDLLKTSLPGLQNLKLDAIYNYAPTLVTNYATTFGGETHLVHQLWEIVAAIDDMDGDPIYKTLKTPDILSDFMVKLRYLIDAHQ